VSESSCSGISFYISRLALTIAFHSDNKNDHYERVQQYQKPDTDYKPELDHEILAGGAAFAAMKVFEDQQRKEGE